MAPLVLVLVRSCMCDDQHDHHLKRPIMEVHTVSSGGLSSNLLWYTLVVSNKSSENEIKE